MKDMLATAFTRASAAKDKAGKKDDSDPAFLLSANLQDLTGRLRDLVDGVGNNARSGVAQADDALARMQGVLEHTDDERAVRKLHPPGRRIHGQGDREAGLRRAGVTMKRLAFTILLVAALPAFAQSPLEKTDPQHLSPVPPGGYNLPLSPPVVPYPLPPQWVTIRSTQDWRKAGRFEKKLSDACAARHFRQLSPLRFRAVFKGEILGVAFGHGLNLVDTKNLADRKLIYLFRNGDTTACTVVSITNEDLRVLNDDPQATPAKK